MQVESFQVVVLPFRKSMYVIYSVILVFLPPQNTAQCNNESTERQHTIIVDNSSNKLVFA